MMPILAADFTGGSLIVGIAILVIGFLILGFIVKTAITLVKVALLVAIAVGAWLGLSYIFG